MHKIEFTCWHYIEFQMFALVRIYMLALDRISYAGIRSNLMMAFDGILRIVKFQLVCWSMFLIVTYIHLYRWNLNIHMVSLNNLRAFV